MPTEAKEATVAELKEAFAASPSAIVAEYRGLRVSDLTAVRRALRDQGVEYRVVKNRLARIAAEQAGVAELAPLLEGPTALALGPVDEALLARTFLDAVRPFRAVAVKGGVIRGRRVDADSVTRLATLPPRETLLAQVGGAIASPLSGMAGVLAAPLRGLLGGLQQLAEQKGAASATRPAGPST